MTLILGNIIALIASILIIIVSCLKTKKAIIVVQTIQVILLALSSLILGGLAGVIINSITIIRNVLCYYNKLNKVSLAIILITLTVCSLVFNNLTLIDLLPLISTLAYTAFINTKSTILLKVLILLNMFCWGIYDFSIHSYTSAIFEAVGTVTSIISIYQLIKPNKQGEAYAN